MNGSHVVKFYEIWHFNFVGSLRIGLRLNFRLLCRFGTNQPLTYLCGTRITANSPVIGGTRYGRLIRLQHNGSYNGNLIATFEAWPNNYGIYRSTDDGLSWTQIATPLLSSTPGWEMQVEPDLFELPASTDNLPAGTILLAGNSGTNSSNSHRIEVWYSTNQGATWRFRGLVDQSTNQGLWEPNLALSSSGQLVCYYSDERFQSSGYNQLLGERVSPDGGLTWEPEIYVVAVPDGVKRPGMAVTAKLPNGQHVLSYEGVNSADIARSTSNFQTTARIGAAQAMLAQPSKRLAAHMWAELLTLCGVRQAALTAPWLFQANTTSILPTPTANF